MFPPVPAALCVWAGLGRLCGPVDCFIAVQPDALISRHAQSLRHRAVGTNDPVLIVQDGHEIRDGIVGLFPFFLGLPQRLLGPGAGRNFVLKASLAAANSSARFCWVMSMTAARQSLSGPRRSWAAIPSTSTQRTAVRWSLTSQVCFASVANTRLRNRQSVAECQLPRIARTASGSPHCGPAQQCGPAKLTSTIRPS